MNFGSQPAPAWPTTVAFANLYDATTYGRTVYMTNREERRLRAVLAAVQDYGFILAPSLEPAVPGYGFADVIAHLRAALGAPFADAALAAAERTAPDPEPPPAALMPVWAFEPDGGSEDALLSSATLWNTNLLVEALRVADDDDPTPVPSVRERFDRWACAARTGRRLATVRLPGPGGQLRAVRGRGPGLIAGSGTGGRVQAAPEGGKGGVGQPAGTPVSFF